MRNATNFFNIFSDSQKHENIDIFLLYIGKKKRIVFFTDLKILDIVFIFLINILQSEKSHKKFWDEIITSWTNCWTFSIKG